MQVKMVVLVSRMDRVEFAVYIFLPGSSILVEIVPPDQQPGAVMEKC